MPDFVFKKMLDIVTPFDAPTSSNLDILAQEMAKPRQRENSKIPAGYTYLAQFVDHDISLDSQARKFPWTPISSSNSFNERIPIFDLETLYGANAEDNSIYLKQNSAELRLGETSVQIDSILKKSPFQDLPRRSDKTAAILDQRNDENLLVAQTHVAFATFHNTIVSTSTEANTTEKYKEARRQTIRHYQYIVLKDLLPKILNEDVLNDVLAHENRFYTPAANDTFIPLEYSVAAFRMGHSMVRNKYNLNSIKKPQTLSDLRTFTGSGGLGDQKSLPSDWLIDWNLFYKLTDWQTPPEKFNFALKITTELSSGLGNLRGVFGFKRESSLAALDLYRGRLFDLPTGQAVAKKIAGQEKVLDSQLIEELLPESLRNVFSENTPLWFYLLAEAQINEAGERLGEVGSRIIAEVFVELLKRSPHSILTPETPPTLNFPSATEPFLGETNGKRGMAEMLNYIESNTINGGFLNPLGTVS